MPRRTARRIRLPDLPDDILIPLLVDVGRDSLSTLRHTGFTCRRLSQLVLHDDSIWKVIHNDIYDDPRLASAFPTPRTSLEWRRTVEERSRVRKFLSTSTPKALKRSDDPSPSARQRLWGKIRGDHKPRIATQLVFQVVLSLYIDLPAGHLPSRNTAILTDMIKSETFQYLMLAFGAHDESGQHIAALLGLQLPWFVPFGCKPGTGSPLANAALQPKAVGTQSLLPTPVQHHEAEQTVEKLVSIDTPGSMWAIVSNAALGTRRVYKTPNGTKQYYARMTGIDSLRGTGLSALHLSDNTSTDWARVTGRWHGIITPSLLREYDHPIHTYTGRQPFPGFFELQLATGPEQVIDEMELAGISRTIANGAWDKLAPELDPCRQGASPLPPLFFYGKREKLERDWYSEGPQFVYGFVYFIPGPTPEVRWTFVVTGSPYHLEEDDDMLPPSAHIAISGVQLGTQGSIRGIVGVWRYLSPVTSGPGDHRPVRPLHDWGSDLAWFFRTDESSAQDPNEDTIVDRLPYTVVLQP